MSWTYVYSDLNGEKTVRTSYKNKFQKKKLTQRRVVKVIKRKSDKLCQMKMLMIRLIVGLIKKTVI